MKFHSFSFVRGSALYHGSRITILTGFILTAALSDPSYAEEFYEVDDYWSVEKVDVHVHIRTGDPSFVQYSREDRFRFVNIAVHSPDAEELELRHRSAFEQLNKNPDRVAVASTFSMNGWDEPGWTDRTLRHLNDTFDRGAVAVKVWKNIGMESRNAQGDLIMIDDPRFQPVWDLLIRRDIRLIGHLGEPRNCWLPLEAMTVNNDRSYFRNNPRYHMFLHPEMPSYEEQIGARDRMLAASPGIRFMGAHLASLEWNVDRIALFLDTYPRATVDTAARMAHLQHQSNLDPERVRRFLNRYQDRILYGTDVGVGAGGRQELVHASARRRWLSDWKYLCTSDVQSVPELEDPVRGLSLPKEVVNKIYRSNAEKFFNRAWSVQASKSGNKPESSGVTK